MTVKVKLHPALARAAVQRAKAEERHSGRESGVAGLMRHALRYYLSKNGYRVAELDAGVVVTLVRREAAQ